MLQELMARNTNLATIMDTGKGYMVERCRDVFDAGDITLT
jgi:hypothetical protein